jgi:hypothetical protein
MGRGTTEDRLAFVRDNKAALLCPQLEECGSVLRRRLRNFGFRHEILSDSDLKAKGQDPTEFQAAMPLEASRSAGSGYCAMRLMWSTARAIC